MDEKDVFIGLRTTRMERHAVRAFALAQGLTVSELIRQRIVEQAVRPVRTAALAELVDGNLSVQEAARE